MLSAAIIYKRLIEVRIAIDTTIFTGVIRSKIYTRRTATGSSLILVPLNIELIFPDTLKTIAIYAAGVSYTKLTEVDILSTGIDIDTMFFRYFAEAACQFFCLLRSQRLNAKRRNTAFDIPI